MSQELLSISKASQWASDYLDRPVTPSNISYLLQYAKIKKYLDEQRKTKINLDELKKYYDEHFVKKQESWKNKLGTDLNWGLSFSHLRESDTTKHVHRLHPYKGKFIPQLVEYFLDSHLNDYKKKIFFRQGDVILDPFMGSGTTLIQSSELGLHSIGIDISDFNCLISIHHHCVVAAVLRGVREADRVRELGRHRDRHGQVVLGGGRLAALQVAGEEEQEPLDGPAAPDHRRGLAERRHHPVRGAERGDAADLRGLLALERCEGADAALALQAHHALVEAPAEQHRAPERAELVGRELGLERGVERALAVEDRQVLDLEPGLEEGSGHRAALPPLFYPRRHRRGTAATWSWPGPSSRAPPGARRAWPSRAASSRRRPPPAPRRRVGRGSPSAPP